MKKISYYLLKYWYAYVFALICMVASIYLDTLSPQVTKGIIDNVIIGEEVSLLPRLLLLIFVIGCGRCIFGYLKELIFDLVSSKIAVDLRRNLFTHIQSLSLTFFDKNNTGELMSRVKDDVDKIWNATGFISMLIIEATVHTCFVLYNMYRISPILTIIPLIFMPIVAILAIVMERKLGPIYEEISEENATLNRVAQENLSGVRAVKAFAREKFEIKKFLSHNKRYYELNMQQSRVFVKYYPYFQFVTRTLPLIVIVLGGIQVIQGTITLGSLGAFAEYSNNIIWPMEMLGWLSNGFASAIASYKKIKKINDQKPEIIETQSPIIVENLKGNIEFDNVSFSLEDNKILTNITFSLDAGKTIGIMGATGTGKTSIINLLQRFYDVNEGEIRLDGVNIKDLSLNDLRKNISLVMQDVFLFSDTIKENVKMGNKYSISDVDVMNAVSEAQAKDFIERMDKQYETIIGERGVGLSGGQKQRISIARALAKKTPILVLDDSTSALDMETEHLIQKELSQTDATKIIIAHRISAVKNADEIIILENGSIVERGTHDILMKLEGYYFNTYMAQYGDYLKDINNMDSNHDLGKEVTLWQ